MTRPTLSTKSRAPEAAPATLPPRGEKTDAPEHQLLTFIVIDRKPHHHPTYAAAAQEREFLQARDAQETQTFNERQERRKLKWRRKQKTYRVMKVVNRAAGQLVGQAIALHTPGDLDDGAFQRALLEWMTANVENDELPDRARLELAIRSYINGISQMVRA